MTIPNLDSVFISQRTPLLRTLVKIVKNASIAEELVQETYLRVARSLRDKPVDHAERLLQRLGNALEQLSERQQRIFILSRLHGQGYAEIAAELGVSTSTVQKELKLIMTLCMTLLERLAPPT